MDTLTSLVMLFIGIIGFILGRESKNNGQT